MLYFGRCWSLTPSRQPFSKTLKLEAKVLHAKIRKLNREQKRHIRENHTKFLKIPWKAGCPWDAWPVSRHKNALFFPVFYAKQQGSLGHRPVDPCLSRRVSQEHPAGVPRIVLVLCAFFFRMQLFLLTVGSFLLTVELFYLQLTILAILLASLAFLLTIRAFLLAIGASLVIVGKCV